MKQQWQRIGVWVVAAGLLSACASGGGLPEAGLAVEPGRPSAELPVNTPARRSAKLHVELGQAYLQSGRNGVALD